ncbi:hypothetical protein SAMN04487770_13637 [Butyrivibrio sp. ob235]|uniref:hypothetical protein n=1 Tax=Butyrivibrio sp. ob235 TaxID=1761780 RepID=UPI0008CF6011|nr:hypothetical protein [Butyrivibrio sp. ob235]SEM38956.1 hypothetical protein SAMN04487770_13637 [Butyrivibrio sp. ob235]
MILDYKEAYKILRDSIEDYYEIIELTFDMPDMFVFWYVNKRVSHGGALDYYAVTKKDGKVIRDCGIIWDNMDTLNDDELMACKVKIPIKEM